MKPQLVVRSLRRSCSRFVCKLFPVFVLWSFCSSSLPAGQPLLLHPENGHYFLFRGKPALFITSGEHYGAVLNRDFNYVSYLDTLARAGLNGTRTWTGVYCESPAAFNITSNTLAPAPGRLICPWARSEQPGCGCGGNKFDLNRWDPAYVARLKDFLSKASRKGIIVELNLFCPFYDESMWLLSPMNGANNINGLGKLARTNVYTLDRNGGLLAVQEALARKLVTELKNFDNLYYEICNEPYFGGVTIEWQRHIADVIFATETPFGAHHLISQNIANEKAPVQDPHPAVSIFNFHYATPPDTVAMNFGLNRVIGDNETGFRGTNDAPYRMEAWDFIIAGGGLFNNLDYSFTVGHEDGTFGVPAGQPGGGNPGLRRQIGFLREFINGFDFVHMRPGDEGVNGNLPPGTTVRALVKPGEEYILYVRSGIGGKSDQRQAKFREGELALQLKLPSGKFTAQWFNTRMAKLVSRERFEHQGGVRTIKVPAFDQDIVLAVRRAALPMEKHK